MERTNTSRNDGLPEGHYKFIISKRPEKRQSANGKVYYIFFLETQIDNSLKSHKQLYWPWDMNDLLKVLVVQKKATEVEKNEYEWDRDSILGGQFEADIVHEVDRKDPNKKWPRIRNITEQVPF